MCGRFTLTTRDVDDVARAMAAEVERERVALYRPRWNVAPTDSHWIVRVDGSGRRRMVPARFGLLAAGGSPIFNARSETAGVLPTFRRAFSETRCLVPADGFYEWQGGRAQRRPLWFHDPAGKHLAFAGLAFQGHDSLSFVILTTAANELMRPIHDRMPVLLSPDGAQRWLSAPDHRLLVPAPEGWLTMREVSGRVNSATNEGPELLEAPPPPRQLKFL